MSLLDNSQFIGVQEHDGKGSLVDFLATIRVGFIVGAIFFLGCDWPCIEKDVRQHFFIANDRGPWWIALQSCEEIISRAGIKLSDFGDGFLLVELLAFVLRDACG